MKALIVLPLAVSLLGFIANPAHSYPLDCNSYGGQTTCRGYDPQVGSFTAENNGLGEVRIRTQ
ncbi:hypothetical protein SXGG_00039, partial [Synechococcus phage S-CBP42]